jgi:ABC-2 type transport system ATP-binding protein
MSELQDTADHLVIAGRGKVIADTSVRELLAAASGDRVTLRTTAAAQAAAVLEGAGAAVAAAGHDVLTVSGLPAARVVALLSDSAVPFSEVSAHRATLEEAYLELTRDAVEFRAGGLGGRPPGPAERATAGAAGAPGTAGAPETTGTAGPEAAR